jgi:hypothetical protein
MLKPHFENETILSRRCPCLYTEDIHGDKTTDKLKRPISVGVHHHR